MSVCICVTAFSKFRDKDVAHIRKFLKVTKSRDSNKMNWLCLLVFNVHRDTECWIYRAGKYGIQNGKITTNQTQIKLQTQIKIKIRVCKITRLETRSVRRRDVSTARGARRPEMSDGQRCGDSSNNDGGFSLPFSLFLVSSISGASDSGERGAATSSGSDGDRGASDGDRGPSDGERQRQLSLLFLSLSFLFFT